jgi:hypothetical protein
MACAAPVPLACCVRTIALPSRCGALASSARGQAAPLQDWPPPEGLACVVCTERRCQVCASMAATCESMQLQQRGVAPAVTACALGAAVGGSHCALWFCSSSQRVVYVCQWALPRNDACQPALTPQAVIGVGDPVLHALGSPIIHSRSMYPSESSLRDGERSGAGLKGYAPLKMSRWRRLAPVMHT